MAYIHRSYIIKCAVYIGNKNYSSWSMRPWVLMKQVGIPFEEVMVRFDSFDAGSAVHDRNWIGIYRDGAVPGGPVSRATYDAFKSEFLALLRAADLTVEQGYDWFEVTQRYVDGLPDSGGGVRPSLNVGYGGGRYDGPYGPYSSSGVGVGIGFNFQGPSHTSSTLEIVMGRGGPPSHADVYDARSVQQNLRARF